MVAVIATGCNYTPVRMVDGQPLYVIKCKGSFAECREKASDLCPGGYDTIESRKETHDDRKERARYPLPPTFHLEIACRDAS